MSNQSIEALFRDLESRDIHLRLVDSQLRVNVPKEGIADELREELGARKQEIIDFLKAAIADHDTVCPALVVADDDPPAPLSFGQQRSWLLHELNKDNPSAYDTLTFNLRMQGALDMAALEHSLTQLVARHEILRTVVGYSEEQPVQCVLAAQDLALPILDLSVVPAAQRKAELDRSLVAAKQKLLDPARGPLFQTQLIKLDSEDHVLVFIIHHMIFDGWSGAILTREFMALYEGFQHGELAPLASPVLQYGDFARWQRNWLQSSELKQHLSYWKDKLGDLATLELPLDYPRPAVQTYNGEQMSIQLSTDVTEKLIKLGKNNDASLFMTMITALGLLLGRYSGQTDIAIGTPITSRDRRELQDMLGFFLNTLVMRLDYSAEADFLGLLSSCRKTCLDAFAHQHLPFEKLVEELQLERDRSRSPLFQVMFVLNGAPDSKPLQLPGLKLSSLAQASNAARFDIEVSVAESSAGFVISFTYNTDLFSAETIQRMLEHFRILLEAIVSNPRQPACLLKLLHNQEIEKVYRQRIETRRDYNLETSLTELFEKQVDATPHDIAVTFARDSLSYLELDQHANRLARYLCAKGVSPGNSVSVFMHRSLEMVIALYGIHKAGAAYVPLDPDYPAERLGWMLEDTASEIILSQEILREKLPVNDAEIILLDGANRDKQLRDLDDSRLNLPVRPDDTAYIIFTSGSTGKPKGVMNAHRGIVNRLLWMQSEFRLNRTDNVLQKTPYSFDVSVWEFFWPLITGARLVVARPEGHKDPAYLSQLIDDEAITTLHFVPSMLRVYLESVDMRKSTSIRRVICSGEALPYDLQQQFFEKSGAELHNLYGPTEAAVDVSHWICRAQDERRIVPIGYPIANTCLYVLDSHLQPVAQGVSGELHIGGVQVAQGYINRPELTAEKFIADPFDPDVNARLYKTGDRARYLPDGSIEYLGRIDNQVKLRGFRIELGEIETLLSSHEQISTAVAVIREDSPGNPELVAYVVMAGEHEFDEASLKEALVEKLPVYMVPAHLIRLAEMPLSANGKVDRKRLPQPRVVSADKVRQATLPSTDAERTIAVILQDLLNIESIGLDDNFFNLGGHSLLAIQAVNRINSAFGSSLSFAQFMSLASVEMLSRHLCTPGQNGKTLEESGESGYPPILPQPESCQEGQRFPLSFAQERLWYIGELYPNLTAYNLLQRINLDFDISIVETALEFLQQRHPMLRTCYLLEAETPVQFIREDMELALCRIDVSKMSEAEAQQAVFQQVREDSRHCFDLANGPVWRSTLVHSNGAGTQLYLIFHHIAVDGWSQNLISHDLFEICESLRESANYQPKPMRLQYYDYVLWQRQLISGSRLDQLQEFWQSRLQGIPPLIELPADKPRPAVSSYQGAAEFLQLSKQLSSELRELARRQQVSMFMLMLAVFKVLLARYARQSDIVVGIPTAGREQPGLEGIVGMFVNTLVLRSDLGGEQSFAAFLGDIRETTLAAYAHQDMPFEKIVEIVKPERDLSRNPVFQVTFTFLVPEEDDNRPEMDYGDTIQSTGFASAQVDLALYIKQEGERIIASFSYATDLFEQQTIRRMLSHYEMLLQAVLEQPQDPINQLRMLTPPEEQRHLQAWALEAPQACRTETIVKIFAKQARQTPDAVAVCYGQESLSYAELDIRSSQLACYLCRKGVDTEVLVGIYLQRSIDLVVAILAVLKAGGGYVPIDPVYPAQRIAFMLEDSQLAVVITEPSLIDSLPEFEGEAVSMQDDRWRDISPSAEPLTGELSSDNVAYVIYTSGSTGQPKGVVINHGNVTRLFGATNANFHFDRDDVWTLFHSTAFDFSVWELWGALLYGGKLVVVPHEISRSPNLFHQLLIDHQVTILNQTPSAFRQLLEADQKPGVSPLASLRLVVFGGEALDPQMLKPWFERYGDLRPQLINMYGITETTVHVTCRRISLAETESKRSLIGAPIADLNIYIVDDCLQPVPLGLPGEMLIAGKGLARGYLNRPELTEQRFITHGYRGQPAKRLYRSGDLARYLPDGDIEYLGRIDHQVKLRGFRIELGEIESILSSISAVAAAIVRIREDQPGDQRLVAYLIAQAGQQCPSDAELHERMEQQLPQYMIPSSLVWLEEFPLTANGKIDYRALPESSESENRNAVEIKAPRDEVERGVAAIWLQYLAQEQISISDNFFRLGGHSLLAVKVVSRISIDFGVDVSFAKFMELATIERIAAYIHQRRLELTAEDRPAVIPLRAVTDALQDGSAYPLTSAQERLWYIYTLYPDMAAYNVQMYLKVETGIEDVSRALELIQQRHSILRTTYRLDGAQAVQVIHSSMPLSLSHLDVSVPGQGLDEKVVRDRLRDDESSAFNLETGPVWRCTALQVDEKTLNLVLTIHHIATDGWSINLIKQELMHLTGRAEKSPVEHLPQPLLQYADYAIWQRQQFQTQRVEELCHYWKQQLDGIPAAIELPTDKPRPAIYSYAGAIEYVALSKNQARQLRQFAQDNEVSMYMLMLSVFKLLLARYTQQSDIVVGTPVSGRTLAAMDHIMGLFINSLVLRTSLAEVSSFSDLLQSVRETTLAAFEYHDLPFEKIVEMLRPERDLSRNPIFQIMFTFLVPEQKPPGGSAGNPVILSEDIESSAAAGAQVDLSLVVKDDGDQIVIGMVYNTDLFETETIRRMLDHYRRLLASAVVAADGDISRLNMLTDEEKQLMLYGWNDTGRAYVDHESLPSLFEKQVRQTPDAIACSFDDQVLSYLQLNQKADALAHRLLARAVQPGELVGVYLERSPDLIIAIFGILKAGSAYVPLDPDYPEERIRYMAEDATIRVLLTTSSLQAGFPDQSVETILLDQANLEDSSTLARLPQVAAHELAYVIYTSGSTGKPKGVMISHGAAVNHMCWMQEEFGLDQSDRVLQKTPISFDASVWEIFLPLLNGARLVLAKMGGHTDSDYMIGMVRDHGITTLQLVPSALRMLLQRLQNPEDLKSLRRMCCGGETLSADLRNAYSEYCFAPLYNLYGPTEATIDAASFRSLAAQDSTTVPIGFPVANTRIYILDQHKQPVPVGVYGELHIAGKQLALGYLNQPGLTSEKFIPDPFVNSPPEGDSGRMYRTGDLGRYRADGAIEFYGRSDRQFKLRGYRIEAEEIETLLMAHPRIANAVVLMREDEPGDQRLVAYLIQEPQDYVKAVSLNAGIVEYLKQNLPSFMVPAFIEWMPGFPLLPSGKIDQKAFPKPSRTQKKRQSRSNMPSTELELIMAGIWEDLLDIDDIEASDMFFDLGGHSLLTLTVVDRFARETNIQIPPVNLINQTLRQLAATAETSRQVPDRDRDDNVLSSPWTS